MTSQTDVRNPLFARFYHHVLRRAEGEVVDRCRRRLVQGASGMVVEIGAGDGPNFPHYGSGVKTVLALEPEPYLRSKAEAARAGVATDIQIVPNDAYTIPLADGEADVVVFALVLCSIPDQARALAEARRVLRPEGELRVFEHVRADHPVARGAQRLADKTFWPLAFGGCHLTRDTLSAIAAAGFDTGGIRRFVMRADGEPPMPYILGSATPNP